MGELEFDGVSVRGGLVLKFADDVSRIDPFVVRTEVMLEQELGLELQLVAVGAVLRAHLRVARLDIERHAPILSVRVGEHPLVGDLEAVEQEPVARRPLEVARVHIHRELLVRRDPPFNFGLQVEAAVAGIIAVAEVAADPPGHPLDDFDLPGLDGFR